MAGPVLNDPKDPEHMEAINVSEVPDVQGKAAVVITVTSLPMEKDQRTFWEEIDGKCLVFIGSPTYGSTKRFPFHTEEMIGISGWKTPIKGHGISLSPKFVSSKCYANLRQLYTLDMQLRRLRSEGFGKCTDPELHASRQLEYKTSQNHQPWYLIFSIYIPTKIPLADSRHLGKGPNEYMGTPRCAS